MTSGQDVRKAIGDLARFLREKGYSPSLCGYCSAGCCTVRHPSGGSGEFQVSQTTKSGKVVQITHRHGKFSWKDFQDWKARSKSAGVPSSSSAAAMPAAPRPAASAPPPSYSALSSAAPAAPPTYAGVSGGSGGYHTLTAEVHGWKDLHPGARDFFTNFLPEDKKVGALNVSGELAFPDATWEEVKKLAIGYLQTVIKGGKKPGRPVGRPPKSNRH